MCATQHETKSPREKGSDAISTLYAEPIDRRSTGYIKGTTNTNKS